MNMYTAKDVKLFIGGVECTGLGSFTIEEGNQDTIDTVFGVSDSERRRRIWVQQEEKFIRRKYEKGKKGRPEKEKIEELKRAASKNMKI